MGNCRSIGLAVALIISIRDARRIRLDAASQPPNVTEGSCGSWSCDNAETGSLTGLDCSAARLREILEHILPISSATQTDAVSSVVSPRDLARKAKARAH